MHTALSMGRRHTGIWEEVLLPESILGIFCPSLQHPDGVSDTVSPSVGKPKRIVLDRSTLAVLGIVAALTVQFFLDGVSQSLAGADDHLFNYVWMQLRLPFGTLQHSPMFLVSHALAGVGCLLLCATQLLVTLRHGVSVHWHRLVGGAAVGCAWVASFMGFLLSFDALHGTAPIYVLGTSAWFFFACMTALRGSRTPRDSASHRRWGHALFQASLMFSTTRMWGFVFLLLTGDAAWSYFLSVAAAGLLAVALFRTGETGVFSKASRQDVVFRGDGAAAARPRSWLQMCRPTPATVLFWRGGAGLVFLGSFLAFVCGVDVRLPHYRWLLLCEAAVLLAAFGASLVAAWRMRSALSPTYCRAGTVD